jgi:hypothetical protein
MTKQHEKRSREAKAYGKDMFQGSIVGLHGRQSINHMMNAGRTCSTTFTYHTHAKTQRTPMAHLTLSLKNTWTAS